MTQLLSIHPKNPQGRLIQQAVGVLQRGGIVAVPTDCCYVLICHLDDKDALARLKVIRRLSDDHLMTLMCQNLADISKYATVNNWQYRTLRAALPGAYTFILPASRELPRRVSHPKRKTVGLRLPKHEVCSQLLAAHGEPVICTSLIMPGETDPLIDAEQVYEYLSKQIEVVIDGGGMMGTTTVVDISGEEPVLVRHGLGELDLLGL